MGLRTLAAVCASAAIAAAAAAEPLTIDTQKVGQTFYGIGGLSGGGATSRLLVDYVEPQRSQILDYMFKPNYGASLHILKVEIGGDSQSTDGTESSHMHSADDLDYSRGYEWWLLSEAKKRNPEIKTYGLPWAYPGWVGGPEQSGNPFKHPELTSEYILKWLQGARSEYGVDIDYIGIWNERSSDANYAKTLRKTLDKAGFANTTLVAKDGGSEICDEMAKDKGYIDAVGVVGLHYPSDYENYDNCRKIGFGLNGHRGGKPIWSSEESSSHDDLNGAACWARIIAAHWVLQGFTSSIMWNLVGAYFHGTAWDASSMLTAQEPWSGNYHSMSPVWATAHVTQFTKPGWDILENGSGSGQLPGGGFYVTYADPATGDWTLTVVKISEDHAPCTRPELPHFQVSAENVTFALQPGVKRSKLAVWYSNFEDFGPDGQVPDLFKRLPDIDVQGDSFALEVKVGAFYTVSTILDGPTKGDPATPVPKSQPSMPLPFSDDFETYSISQEGKWWSDQIGAFEVHYESGSAGNKVMRQMVPEKPIGWGDRGTRGPVSLIGMKEWQDVEISVAFKLPPDAAPSAAGCVGTRANQMWGNGITLCVFSNGTYFLSVGGPMLGGKPRGHIYSSGVAARPLPDAFNQLSLTTVKDLASGSLNGKQLFDKVQIRDMDTGFAVIGASDWFPIVFDDVSITPVGPRWGTPAPACPAAAVGGQLFVRKCQTNGLVAEDQDFRLLPSWGLRHAASGLCASAAAGGAREGGKLSLAKCDPKDLKQQFKNDYTSIRDSIQPLTLKEGGDHFVLGGDVTGEVFLTKPGRGSRVSWKSWAYFPNTKQLRNQYDTNQGLGYPLCLSTCKEPAAELEVAFV